MIHTALEACVRYLHNVILLVLPACPSSVRSPLFARMLTHSLGMVPSQQSRSCLMRVFVCVEFRRAAVWSFLCFGSNFELYKCDACMQLGVTQRNREEHLLRLE
ncbi:unnamed protein product [Laminaria digitata]